MRVVIIGGVAGGMSAATRLRRLSEEVEIIVLEKGLYVSFANCGLPYHLSGEIVDREKLIVQSPKQLHRRFNIDVRPLHEVTKIDRKAKKVYVEGIKKYELSYDVLVLSPGAKPVIPPIEGIIEATNLFTLRNILDMDAILAYRKDHQAKEVLVVGGGFIGLETAENLHQAGLSVTLVEASQHVLPTVDPEIAQFIENKLKEKGIKVITGEAVNGFKKAGKVVTLTNNKKLTSDITILAIGVMPENTLAVDADLEIGVLGGIVVDEEYRTNDKDIYAIGDAILVKHHVTKEPVLLSLASPANRHGRQVADCIMGMHRKDKGSLGTAIVRVFDLAIGSTGLSERVLREKELVYKSVHILANHHAGYFPEAQPITLKLLFHPTTGQIYGAQAVGKEGVDKRIDTIATAIKANLTVADLPELEFAYAPPFGSAKDPVNMIGYAALNIIEGLSDLIQYYELEAEIKSGAVLIDVRTNEEILQHGQMLDAINIPVDEIRERLSEIPKDTPIIVTCQSGLRSYIAQRILMNKGYQVKSLDGGFHIYSTMYPKNIKK